MCGKFLLCVQIVVSYEGMHTCRERKNRMHALQLSLQRTLLNDTIHRWWMFMVRIIIELFFKLHEMHNG